MRVLRLMLRLAYRITVVRRNSAHRTEDASSLDGAGVVMVVRVRPRAVESLLGHDGDWLFGHHTASKAVQQGRIVDAGDIIELRR